MRFVPVAGCPTAWRRWSRRTSVIRPDAQITVSEDRTRSPHDGRSLLFTAAESAAAVRISVRQWWRLDAMGKVPAAVRIGRAKRWRAEELRRWVEKGCPDRITWKAINNG